MMRDQPSLELESPSKQNLPAEQLQPLGVYSQGEDSCVTSGDGEGNELSHFYVEVCYDSFRYSKGAEWQLQPSQRTVLRNLLMKSTDITYLVAPPA